MDLLEIFEFQQEGVERPEVFHGIGAVHVEGTGEGESEQEVVCCAARELARIEGGKSGKVRLGETDRVEPVDAAFVTVTSLAGGRPQYGRYSRVTHALRR